MSKQSPITNIAQESEPAHGTGYAAAQDRAGPLAGREDAGLRIYQLPFGSIAELATAIRQGLSPVDVLEIYLARIAQFDGVINAMLFVDAEGARAAARQAERDIRAGHDRGPLHGVPIALKDVIDVAGWPTACGSRLFDGQMAQRDADCVAHLRAAGAVIIGKTNMHELTVGNHANPWWGKVRNPRDLARGTGGTSSGSAAAVAAGFCMAAVGTDTGGSNRSTAAATGLVGYKPSNGLISAAGVRPTAPILDTIGPITLTVADARLVTQAMSGPIPLGAITAAAPFVLATCPDLGPGALDPAVRQSVADWIEQLRSAGVTVVERAFAETEELVGAGLAILQYEFAAEYAAPIGRDPSRVGEAVHLFLEAACRVDLAHFTKALETRSRLRRRFFALMEGADALLVPTAPGLAPRLSDELTQVGDAAMPYGLAGGHLRRWANVFEMPAIALPLPVANGPLSASVQLAALPGRDADVFHMAQSLPRP